VGDFISDCKYLICLLRWYFTATLGDLDFGYTLMVNV